MLLAVTGGIGSGKSTASRLFTEFGFQRFDSDEIVKTQILTSAEVVAAISARFGENVVTKEGRVDRGAVARRVFSSDVELQWLEELVHPRLFFIWRRLISARGETPLLFEVPLLFEKRLENWFDFTICVATSSTNQLARLAERGMNKALAEQRISKQLPLAQKIELADFVLSNDGTLSFLRDQVAALAGRLSNSR